MTSEIRQIGSTEIATGMGRSRLNSRTGRLIAADQASWVAPSSRSPSIHSRIGSIWPRIRHSEAMIASSVSTRAIPSTLRYSCVEPSM